MDKMFLTATVKEVNKDERTIVAWASKAVLDRDREMLPVNAWKWKDIQSGSMKPKFLAFHDHKIPAVGRVLWLKRESDGVKFKSQFNESAMGKELWPLYRDGDMDSFSVGFIPDDGGWDDFPEAEKSAPKRVYKDNSCSLLEISCVNIPSCPAAVVDVLHHAVESGKIQEKEFVDAVKEMDDAIHTKPETTENFHHIPVRSKNDFVQESFRTITISAKDGIKAVIGKLKSDPQGSTVIQSYLFDVKKFSMEEAKKWVEEHKKFYEGELIEALSLLPVDEEGNIVQKAGRTLSGATRRIIQDCLEKMGSASEALRSYLEGTDITPNPDEDLENKAGKFQCECISCGYKTDSDSHCRDMKCPKCGGEMRRAERPGPGKELELEDDEEFELVRKEFPSSVERWNKSLSKAFNLAVDERPAAVWEHNVFKEFFGCSIKDIFLNSHQIPSPMVGTYLAGIKEISGRNKLLETRNFTSYGDESPPIYETMKLNSTKSDNFLVSGIQFYRSGEVPFVLKFTPNWMGMKFMVITHKNQGPFNMAMMEEIHAWAKKNNFLRNERFALSGDFLEKTEDDWDGLVLDDDLKTIVKNSVGQINKKKDEMDSRGMLFVGRPGTGKTKTGRAIMNNCDSTFIWVSSKDFGNGRAHDMLSLAFSLSKELAPSVLFLEDIDTWLGDFLVDLLKTELDGLKQNKGVITILTSNNPERLPEALLDRPGRFHHVLDFKLPKPSQRSSMIKMWIGESVDEESLDTMVTETNGFSGAHLKELVDFAKIISEENGTDIEDAMRESLTRLLKQKRLVEEIRRNKKSYEVPEYLGSVLVNKDFNGEKAPLLVKPDEAGKCPDGYELGADKMCHLASKKEVRIGELDGRDDFVLDELVNDEQVAFKLVDGDEIRKSQDEDFNIGGHHYIYDFIPEDEIWIETRMLDEDIIAAKAQQFVERQLMKYFGFTYEMASNASLVTEKIVRHVTDEGEDGFHDERHLHMFTHSGNHKHVNGKTSEPFDEPEVVNQEKEEEELEIEAKEVKLKEEKIIEIDDNLVIGLFKGMTEQAVRTLAEKTTEAVDVSIRKAMGKAF